MGEIIEFNKGDIEPIRDENDLLEITEGILIDTSAQINTSNSLSMPIAQLATLGAGVSSLIPALNTITTTTTVGTQGLYTLVNASVGDVLKVAKNGNFWGRLRPLKVDQNLRNFRKLDHYLHQQRLLCQ